MTRITLNRLALSLLVLLLLVLMHGRWLDVSAREYTEQGLKRVLLSYAVARGLNGMISVAQGTEVSVEPVGIGMTFTPGQILDPVNDLIEQFSWLVLLSGVSLGIQRVLIAMTSGDVFTWLLSAALLLTLVILWLNRLSTPGARLYLRIVLVLLVLRFLVPVISLLNQAVYAWFLQPQYETSQAALEKSGNQLQQQQAEPVMNSPVQDEGMLERLKRAYRAAGESLDVDARLDQMKQAAADMSERILDLMVVFTLTSLLFPLLFLWLGYKLALRLLHLV